MIKIPLPRQAASVIYTLQVLENGRVIRTVKPKRNLILDSGLDFIGGTTYGWATVMAYCRIGSGTTPTKRASGAITLSRSGNIVTASASFFISADNTRVLKFDSGEEMRITAYTSGTQVTVDTSGTIASSPGTVWYVEQTALTTNLKTQAQDASPNATVWDGVTGTGKISRVFTFSIETGPVNYTEIGWSPVSGGSLFSRDLFAGGGLALTLNQQLVVTADLYVTFSPLLASVPVSIAIAGIGTLTGDAQWQNTYGWYNVNLLTASPPPAFIMNGSPGAIALGTPVMASGNTYPAGASSANTKFSNAPTGATYVTKSFTKTWTHRFNGALAGAALTGIRSIGLGTHSVGTPNGGCYFRVLLDSGSAFDKDAYYQLELSWVFTWGRVLIN